MDTHRLDERKRGLTVMSRAATLLLWGALAAAGCSETPPPAPAATPTAAAASSPAEAAADTLSAPVPATPSYEVAIATAAAERNHSLTDCESGAEPQREACVEAAHERFRQEQAELEYSRAEQP